MATYDYLIVGGGMAGYAAVTGIREVDKKGTIAILGAEMDPPYMRPPLSKGLWKDEDISSVWNDLDPLNVEPHLGVTVRSIDARGKSVSDEKGVLYGFRKLLLATGSTPRRLPFGGDDIIYFRTVRDYQRLRALADTGQHFVVIGGGFIGSEIAAALAMNGKEVSLVFPDRTIGARVYPADLGAFLNDYYRSKGVHVLAQSTVTNVERKGAKTVVHVRPEEGPELRIEADGVVAGIGVEPNVALGKAAGLRVDNGILVDEMTRTAQPDILAAGDVASFYNPALDKRLRVEHEDNANSMGRVAGLNMAGQATRYDHIPFFYSDLFDLGYEAVGDLDARLETMADWEEPYHQGVVYYLRDRRVRGVLLWNVWDKVDAARQVLTHGDIVTGEDVKGQIKAA